MFNKDTGRRLAGRSVNVSTLARAFTLILVFALAQGLISCSSHQERVNTISDSVVILSESWEEAQTAALALYDAGVLRGEQWERVKAVQAEGGEIMRQIWKGWREVPKTDAAISNFLAGPTFANGLRLAAELAELAQKFDLKVKILTLKPAATETVEEE